MERKVFIVGNPASGKKKLGKILVRFISYLETQGLHHTFSETSLSENPVSHELTKDFTDLIIIGGDGTINSTINAFDLEIPVSIIPAGTGNDFVKNVNLGKSEKEQFETAIHGQVIEVDLGQCNNRKFVNGVGIGFDGQIVENMISKRVPLLTGHAAYYYHVLTILAGYKEKSFSFSIDDERFEKDLILLTIANGTTFGGGFKLTPGAQINDGLLDVCEIGKLPGIKRFMNIHRLSSGTHAHLDPVNLYQAKSIAIEDNPALFAHIDGEQLGNPPFKINILPRALRLRTAN